MKSVMFTAETTYSVSPLTIIVYSDEAHVPRWYVPVTGGTRSVTQCMPKSSARHQMVRRIIVPVEINVVINPGKQWLSLSYHDCQSTLRRAPWRPSGVWRKHEGTGKRLCTPGARSLPSAYITSMHEAALFLIPSRTVTGSFGMPL